MMQNGILKIIRSAISTLLALFVLLGAAVNPKLSPFVPTKEKPTSKEGIFMTLIENGSSPYRIVTAESAAAPEATAAKKLQGVLFEMSGVTLPIVPDSAAPVDTEIVVGKTNREGTFFPLSRDGFGAETVRYFTAGKRLIIAGAQQRGTLYGVYEFLKEVLDCHWYTASLISIPRTNKVEIPVELQVTYTPQLEYRETDWISPCDVEYSLANHLNSNVYRTLSAENGGWMGYIGSFAHTLTTRYCSADSYFASHPEYFALRDGVRVKDQLCLSNPKVLTLVISEVRQAAKQNPAAIISLTQNDNQKYCECAACSATDAAEGAHSGSLLRFINAVADAVKDEYPNLAIDTFAYQYTRKAPKLTRPRDNVIIRLCSIECCFSHALSDVSCSQNAEFAADLKDWSKISNRLYVWDYTTNYAHYCGPFPDFGVLKDNMKFFRDNHVVGLYEEGNYTASQCDAEFAEYRAYLLSRLMWNPDCDLEKESDGFLKAYYGKGWQYIREYLRFTCEKASKTGHTTIYIRMDNDKMFDFTANELVYLDDLWQHAKEEADTAEARTHVERSELSWRYWKGCNKVQEFSRLKNATGWKNENEKLYNDLKRFGITRLSEGNAALTDAPDFSGVPSDWKE